MIYHGRTTMISRFPVRIFSAALLPGLIVSCHKESSASTDLVQQVTETAASNEILRDESEDTREKVDTLTRRVQELEVQIQTEKESRQEIIHRLKDLEKEQILNQQALREKTSSTDEKEKASSKVEKPATPPPAEKVEEIAFDDSKPLPTSITDKVVVIEGDMGRGTGFLCSTEGALWLYTAAHVISGNKSIIVRDQQNNRFQTFDSMEVAEGVDLVRLKIVNSSVKGLELESPEKSAEIGDPIAAVGNSDGTGVVAPENGEIRGKGPESWEVSTQIIPGNSGGPVIARKDLKVIGIVTHLLLGKKETWAADTRFAEVRRFAARLDRPYKWTPITPARFLKEFQIIEQLDNDTKLAYAAITVYQERTSRSSHYQPRESSPEQDAFNKWQLEARELLQQNPNSGIAVTLNKILGRSTNYSQSENRRELLESIRSKVALGDNLIKPEAFTWYHRESYNQSLIWRRKLIEQLRN